MDFEDGYMYELCPVCGDYIDYCTGCPVSDDYLNGFE